MIPCPPCGGQLLPITTGRVGLSQTSGEVQFYGHNYRGTGMGLFRGWWSNCPPGATPWLTPPAFQCKPWAGGCSCGCNPCCCQDNTACFVSLLTNIGPWCCYWQDRQYTAWLTGTQPWPSTAQAANQTLANTLPAACFPPAPTPVQGTA
jgi:hypothetical protein